LIKINFAQNYKNHAAIMGSCLTIWVIISLLVSYQ
jgi:hypothetical protein